MGDDGINYLTMSNDEFARRVGTVYSDRGDLPRLMAMAQVRAALQAERNAVAQRSTARWTKVLALVTTLLVGSTMWVSIQTMSTQSDTLHELRRQNCLAEINAYGVVTSDLRFDPKAVEAIARVIDRCK